MPLAKDCILIITRESRKEIEKPTFGGSRLIKELIMQLITKKFRVFILSVFDLNTQVAHLLGLNSKNVRTKSRLGELLKNDRLRWSLALCYLLLVEVLSRIDIRMKKEVTKIFDRMRPYVVLYNGPIGAFTFLSIARRKGIPFVLCEHNVDYYFYQDKIGYNLLVSLYKMIELSICRMTDLVLCFNPWDKLRLVKNGIYSEKILVWRFTSMPRKTINKEEAVDKIPECIRERVRNKLIVGFVGANYSLNILSVKYILQIAKKLPNVTFLIIGSVGETFKESETPSNVIFTGYVEDVEMYIAVTDVLLNLKFTPATGIEAKMFDYLKFNKPIISTKIGSLGFEHLKNVIVVDNLNEVIKKIEELERGLQK